MWGSESPKFKYPGQKNSSTLSDLSMMAWVPELSMQVGYQTTSSYSVAPSKAAFWHHCCSVYYPATFILWLEGCIDDERQFKMAKRSQAPGDATVLKRFFRDNFAIFRHRSKRIAFLESVKFSTWVCMQIFNFRDGHVTTFRHLQGSVSAKCLVTDSQTSKRHTFRVSAFHRYHWFG